jgi:DNA polymerase-3 subunit alpha
MQTEFVHLHNHSEYSLLDGLIRLSNRSGGPSSTLESLAKQNTRAFALTDHGNMYGAIELYRNCSQVGINPIVGCEMYFSKGSRFDRGHSQKDNCHLTVLARNFEGYQNLMELVSKGYSEGYYYDPRIDKELLAKHSKGLIVLSGCLKSETSQHILAGNLVEAEKLCVWFRDTLAPDCFYLEIMDHGIEKQRQVLKALLEIHNRTNIPLIATNDCHYAHPSDYEAHDARLCISTGRKLEDSDRLKFETHDFHLKTPAEMHKLFSFSPQSLTNTLKVAEMCHLKIPMDQLMLPQFQVPEGLTQDSYLESLCLEGLRLRLGEISSTYQERLNYEISIIRKMGFSGYFLIVWDFIRYARTQNIPVGPGRGSGAGSLVAYALKITSIDPLKHRLLFERFLNPDRKSMPDLDIDFADTGRDRVIAYVREKYGADNVAQIITFGSLGAKLVIRDVARVMGLPISEADRIAKMIPTGPHVTLNETLQSNPDLKEAAKAPSIRKLLDLALKLEGLKRHTGVHAAGTVITKEPVVRYTPLAKGAHSDVTTTQYDGDSLSKLGLLKIDFLGLRTLSIIADAVQLIQKRRKTDFDIETIPTNDEKTFDLLRSAKALGIFQLDSQGMRDLLYRLKPTGFEDIVSLIALFRPGPMQSGMLDMFVERKHGRKRISYPHALLEPILKETYGCVVFQEQVMEIAKKLADFSPGQADSLRKAMGKKIPEEIEKLRGDFISGGARHAIPKAIADKIYDQLVEFGGYGFNKSHSAAYGLVAYQTAYLKANYPIEFMTALLSSEIGHSTVQSEGKENKLVVYLGEAERMKIEVLAPDVQKSEAAFSIESENAIRFGLVAIKNVGHAAAEGIVKTRKEKDFSNWSDFLARMAGQSINKRALESIVKAGAADKLDAEFDLPLRRSQFLAEIEGSSRSQAARQKDLANGQGLLFGIDEIKLAPNSKTSTTPILSQAELLKAEKELLGFYLSGHPLTPMKERLDKMTTHSIAALNSEITTPVKIAGLITQVKRMTTKAKGEPWARAVLEDLSGEITLLAFPRVYASLGQEKLQIGFIALVSGRLSFRDSEAESAPEMIVETIEDFDSIWRKKQRLKIMVKSSVLEENTLMKLRDILQENSGPCPVFLETGEKDGVLELEQRVDISPNLLKSIEALVGQSSCQIESVF